MAYPQSFYSSSDFTRKYGRNPYVPARRKVSGLIDRMLGDPEVTKSPRSSVARVRDPEVGDYMSDLLAGQGSSLDDYVRRAAGAGIRRAGMNVAGGPALDSALHQDALSNLARGYSDRFRQAMDYDKYVKATEAAQHSDKLRNLANMFGVQDKYLRGQADWQSRFGDYPVTPAAGATGAATPGSAKDSAAYDDELKKMLLERTQGQVGMEKWRNDMEKQEYATAQEKQRGTEGMWRKLLQKARLADSAGRTAAGWSNEEDAWMERLGVELGYLKPWTRQLMLKVGR
jgi:hypothetical protein